MPVIGRQFFFPFSHCTRVDAAIGHLGDAPTAVEIEVFSAAGERLHRRRLLDVPARGSLTTRHDPKSDNLARFVGANMAGLVAVRGDPDALLTVSALCIGKGLTSTTLLRPLQAAAGTQLQAPVAIGQSFRLLLANPHAAQVRVVVEVAPSGEEFVPLQAPVTLERNQVVLSEDAFTVGKPSIVRVHGTTGIPFLAWGLGVGADRSGLYPIYP